MAIQTVGIIGAGTMGNGIAQACAASGIDAVMQDVSDAAHPQRGKARCAGPHPPGYKGSLGAGGQAG